MAASLSLRVALVATTALLFVGLYSTEIADTDFWWNLATGRYLAAERSLPVPDPFAWTTELGAEAYPGEERVRRFNLTHEWLAQLVWFGVYSLGGFPAVVLWKALLLGFVSAAAGRLAWLRSGSLVAGVLAALAGAPVLVSFAADRPALVSFASVAGFVSLLEHYRQTGRRWTLWTLPALQLVWANSHGGFFLGYVVLGAYSADALSGPAERRKPLWIASAAAFAVSGLNPAGFGVFAVLSGYRQSFLTRTLIEWSAPPLWGPPYVFQALLYAAAVALAWRWRRARIADALLLVAFGAAALMAFRNLPLVAFLAPVLLAAYLPIPAWLDSRRAAAAALAGVAAIGLWRREAMFQLRAAEWKFPVEAARVLDEIDPAGRLFNSYEYGGYLMWAFGPRRQVFIDGRALNESVYADYLAILHGVEGDPGARARLLDRYEIGAVLTNGFEYVSGAVYPLILWLGDPNNADWRLVHADGQAVVFVRATAENLARAAGREIPKSGVTEHLETSCRLSVEHDPELSQCARTLALLYLQAGDADRARAALDLYLSAWPWPDPEAEALAARLRLGQSGQ